MGISVTMFLVGLVVIFLAYRRVKDRDPEKAQSAVTLAVIGTLIASVGLASLRPVFGPATATLFEKTVNIGKVWAQAAFSSFSAAGVSVGTILAALGAFLVFNWAKKRGNLALTVVGLFVLVVLLSPAFPRFVPASATAISNWFAAFWEWLKALLGV